MTDESKPLGQDEIEQLLRQNQQGKSPDPSAPNPGLDPHEIEALLSGTAGTKSGGAGPGADPGQVLGRSDIEAILGQSARSEGSAKSATATGDQGQLARGDVEFLLNQAQQALASIDGPSPANPAIPAVPFQLREFAGAPPSTERATLDLIRDVDLDLKIELGRTHMYLEEVLKLRKGSVVPLDKLAGDPVDIYVNGRLIARGEVLVLNDNFSVRVAELITGDAAKPG